MKVPIRREITVVDNRDTRTTWLWIDTTHYIEVDPYELLRNALENSPIADEPLTLVLLQQVREALGGKE
jgi:hypothetical protein